VLAQPKSELNVLASESKYWIKCSVLEKKATLARRTATPKVGKSKELSMSNIGVGEQKRSIFGYEVHQWISRYFWRQIRVT
jgi:hypothetical protein